MQKLKTLRVVSVCLVAIIAQGCATPALDFVNRRPAQDDSQPDTPASRVLKYPFTFFATPQDGHKHFIDAINGAKYSIVMEMFHLTDPEVLAALGAKKDSVNIELILNYSQLKGKSLALIQDLVLAHPNIHYYSSSQAFKLTHTKAMVIDSHTSFITSTNLTNEADTTRDYGVSTEDPLIAEEMLSVFHGDEDNSVLKDPTNPKSGGHETRIPERPAIAGPSPLIWSPGSEDAIADLINEAVRLPPSQRWVHAAVETIGDFKIQSALELSASKGVDVQLILPMCTENPNALIAYDHIPEMPDVKIRLSRHPSDTDHPYMHGKMIVIGNGKFYLGSINFSKSSTLDDRELGLIAPDPIVSSQLDTLFRADFLAGALSTDPKPTSSWCHHH